MSARRTPRVLSIAGSDSGGGAGIQADLKAFARCGVHGMTAITAVTWQNTVAVEGVTVLPPEAIIGQVRAVADDIGVDAVKIGMLGTAATIRAVAEALSLVGEAPIVLDPVMVAESGAPLLEAEARTALVAELVPKATVVTPNHDEARALVETAGGDAEAAVEELARSIHRLGPGYVVVTGGHAEDGATDLFFDGAHMVRYRARGTRMEPPTGPAAPTPRHSPRNSLSAAIHSTLPARRSESPRMRSATACARSEVGQAPSTSSELPIFPFRDMKRRR